MHTTAPEDAVERRSGVGRRVLATGLIVVAALVTLAAWALASPPASSPDDDYHLASILCAGGTDTTQCLAVPDNPDGRIVPAMWSGAAACFAYDFTKSASCQEDLSDPAPTVGTEHGNWTGAYPPVFYRFMSLFVIDEPGTSVLLMRLANGLLTVAAAVALAWSLPARRRLLASVPLLVTSVPLGLNLFTSTNPSSWTVLGVAIMFPAAYFAFETTGRRRGALGVLTVVGAVLASGSRADGCLFVAMIAVMVLLLRARQVREHPLSAAPAVVALAIAASLFLTAGHSAVISGNMGGPSEEGRSVLALLLLNTGSLPVLWLGSFGSGVMGQLGWLDTPVPPLVGFSAIAVWFVILLQGLQQRFAAKTVALGLVGAALVVYPLVLLVQTKVLVGVAVQPRYLLPLLVLFTTIALISPRGRELRLGHGTFWVCVAGLGLANALALHVQMRRYVTGLDVSRVDLGAGKEWWWPHGPGPMVVWLLGSLAFLALAYAILSQVRDERPAPGPLRAGWLRAASTSASSASAPPIGSD